MWCWLQHYWDTHVLNEYVSRMTVFRRHCLMSTCISPHVYILIADC